MDLENFPVKDTVRMVASLLQQITLANDRRAYTPASPVSPTSSPPLHSLASSYPIFATPAGETPSQKTSPPPPLPPPPPPPPPSSSTSLNLSTAASSIHHVFSRFHSQTVPSISILSYLNRILKYAPCTNCVFISILVYLDRMTRAKLPFVLCSPNIHRCIIVCVMVATKFASDVFYTNAHYAKVGGVQLMELNQLELEFLFLNEFNLLITPEEFQIYAKRLLEHTLHEQKKAAALNPPLTSSLWFPNLISSPPPPPSPRSPHQPCSTANFNFTSGPSNRKTTSSNLSFTSSPSKYINASPLSHKSIPPPPPPHPTSTRRQLRRYSSNPIVTVPLPLSASAFSSSTPFLNNDHHQRISSTSSLSSTSSYLGHPSTKPANSLSSSSITNSMMATAAATTSTATTAATTAPPPPPPSTSSSTSSSSCLSSMVSSSSNTSRTTLRSSSSAIAPLPSCSTTSSTTLTSTPLPPLSTLSTPAPTIPLPYPYPYYYVDYHAQAHPLAHLHPHLHLHSHSHALPYPPPPSLPLPPPPAPSSHPHPLSHPHPHHGGHTLPSLHPGVFRPLTAPQLSTTTTPTTNAGPTSLSSLPVSTAATPTGALTTASSSAVSGYVPSMTHPTSSAYFVHPRAISPMCPPPTTDASATPTTRLSAI